MLFFASLRTLNILYTPNFYLKEGKHKSQQFLFMQAYKNQDRNVKLNFGCKESYLTHQSFDDS